MNYRLNVNPLQNDDTHNSGLQEGAGPKICCQAVLILSPYPHPSRSGQGEQLPWRPSGKAGLSAAAGEGGFGKVLPKLLSGRTEDALDGGGMSLWQHSPWGHWTLTTRSTILKRKQGGVSHSYAQEGIMGGCAMGPIGGSSCFHYSGTHTWYL